jgi:two-component system alkaline phosphatase synthesis response regulator PhoP
MIELIRKELKMRGKENYSIDEIVEVIERYTKKPKEVESSGFLVDMESREIIHNGEKIYLPLKEFLLIDYFIRNKNKVVRRNELLSSIWGDDVVVIDRTIDVHIRRLRHKFPTIPIDTIKCVGYIWKD